MHTATDALMNGSEQRQSPRQVGQTGPCTNYVKLLRFANVIERTFGDNALVGGFFIKRFLGIVHSIYIGCW